MLIVGIVVMGLSSCTNDDTGEQLAPDEVRVYFVCTLDVSSGRLMARAKSHETIFGEFYEKIKTGELVAPSYELTMTEVNTGETYTFKGQWGSHTLVTMRTGTYRVVGTSTAEGENIQDKCSFRFDEQIDIDMTTTAITLHANYDCFLLIFDSTEIQTLQNYNGETFTPFYAFGEYRYAFVKESLYNAEKHSEAYIGGQYTSGVEFKVFTGNLNFEKGKYYVYNSVSNSFDIPPMDDGSTGTQGDHAYVDLGLPSGTLWATCNIGASSPEERGDCFAWGETTTRTTYQWSVYKWCNGSSTSMTKYCNNSSYGYNGYTDNKTELDVSDDAAYVNWGSDWRIPSVAQINELINSSYTTTEWTTQNGVSGRKITSKANGNSIFLPTAGYNEYGSFYDVSSGYYWSRKLYTSDVKHAGILYFHSGDILDGNGWRPDGLSIRPVRNKETIDHEYVDLGLPSGTLWATCNVGANSPEEYGDYFAWGETTGYNGGKTTFNWSTYKYCNGSNTTLTKYNNSSSYGTVDNKTELELSDDAAYVNWGSKWRMPSLTQLQELVSSSYTTTTWTTQNGVYGRKITSNTNGNSIFLPAAGYRGGGSLDRAGTSGDYWSRTLDTSRPYAAYSLGFGSSDIYSSFDYGYRSNGRSVRPVRNQ